MIKKDTETKKILESIKNPDNFTIEEKKNRYGKNKRSTTRKYS